MTKAKKRKPDLRRIRPTKTYTLPEIAEGLDRNIATVRRWLGAGLPALDERKPTLVAGDALRDWLKKEWSRRKRKCEPCELYCFKCRSPRLPKRGTVLIQDRNEKTVAISALCSECGSKMNQAGSLSRKVEIEARFQMLSPKMQHLTGCDDPSDKHTKQAVAPGRTGTGDGEGQIPLDFESRTDE